MFSVWERLFSALLRSCRQPADLQEKSCSSRQARPRTTERGRWRSRGARGDLRGPPGGRTAADGSSTSARRSSARARRLERVNAKTTTLLFVIPNLNPRLQDSTRARARADRTGHTKEHPRLAVAGSKTPQAVTSRDPCHSPTYSLRPPLHTSLARFARTGKFRLITRSPQLWAYGHQPPSQARTYK